MTDQALGRDCIRICRGHDKMLVGRSGERTVVAHRSASSVRSEASACYSTSPRAVIL